MSVHSAFGLSEFLRSMGRTKMAINSDNPASRFWHTLFSLRVLCLRAADCTGDARPSRDGWGGFLAGRRLETCHPGRLLRWRPLACVRSHPAGDGSQCPSIELMWARQRGVWRGGGGWDGPGQCPRGSGRSSSHHHLIRPFCAAGCLSARPRPSPSHPPSHPDFTMISIASPASDTPKALDGRWG